MNSGSPSHRIFQSIQSMDRLTPKGGQGDPLPAPVSDQALTKRKTDREYCVGWQRGKAQGRRLDIDQTQLVIDNHLI